MTASAASLRDASLSTARSTSLRGAWFLSAVFWSAFAVVEGVNHGLVATLFAAGFFIAPDLTLLVGRRGRHRLEDGQLAPAAVPVYNAAHRAVVPLALIVVYWLVPGSWPPAFAALCGWLAHISWDRVFGFGLRTKEGFQRP